MSIEAASGGVPQDVEWAVARDLPFPDSVFFLQHRPETTWGVTSPGGGTAGDAAGPADAGGPPAPPRPADPPPGPAFDPVKYALRNVFKVPGS